MFVTEGVYTRKVAEVVGSAVQYMRTHPQDTDFYKLELVRYNEGKAQENWTELFRPVEDHDAQVTELEDGREVVHCVSKTGRRLDIIFGNPAERTIEPATVLLGPIPES